MASAVVSTLHHVTEKKLEKLDEQRNKFSAKRAKIIATSDSKESLADKVKTLLEGCEKLNITIDQQRSGVSVKNVKQHFLEQAKHDPSVSPAILEQWRQKVLHDLEIQGLKYEYASLFGRLVTEWIENPNDTNGTATTTTQHEGDDASSTTSFERVGREEMHEQRKEWEEYAFTAKHTDQQRIEQYLDRLFGSTVKAKKLRETPLQQLRTSLGKFEDQNTQRFDADIVKTCINGLLKADLFAGRKREALADLTERQDVLKEMADVLNMDLDSLDDWEWDPQPVPLHMRRQLNGKYRVYMDEELHQAILLQFIGMQWATTLKRCFTAFFHSGAWLVTPYQSMQKRDRLRREYFLGSSARTRADDTVRNTRRQTYADDYFMTQLPGDFHGGGREYGDEWDEDAADNEQKSPMVIKQQMLRLATSELIINTKLYGQFTILQSDFKWFGPSLPHSTIFAVLKYFGVKAKWLRFFKTFLEVPVVFSHDGPDAEARKRQRGIPMSHVLSDALGEAVLFCLDFAVNQRTKGANIYRFHDDLWFWGQETVCVQAWDAMLEFADVMGMELNDEKTGTVQVAVAGKTAGQAAALPKGKVRWGFLELDAETGRWAIDQKEVDEHIVELKRQLSACRSVFAWVQAYNSYVDRFFTANFGLPARCFGREHVKMQIKTFEHIHQQLLGESSAGASVTSHLRKWIEERFGVSDVPDGFFYLPVELGGLQLRSPFIPLFAQVRHPFIAPLDRIDRAFEAEEQQYEVDKERFDNGDVRRAVVEGAYKPTEDEPFMGLDEYTRFREETSAQLHGAYNQLLEASPEEVVEQTPEVTHALRGMVLADDATSSGFSKNWPSMKHYWKWVLELYAADMIQRFGGLNMADPGLLPVGLVSMLRSEKVRWQS